MVILKNVALSAKYFYFNVWKPQLLTDKDVVTFIVGSTLKLEYRIVNGNNKRIKAEPRALDHCKLCYSQWEPGGHKGPTP